MKCNRKMNARTRKLLFKQPVAANGRVTIPKTIRDYLELDTEAVFVLEDDKILLEKPGSED